MGKGGDVYCNTCYKNQLEEENRPSSSIVKITAGPGDPTACPRCRGKVSGFEYRPKAIERLATNLEPKMRHFIKQPPHWRDHPSAPDLMGLPLSEPMMSQSHRPGQLLPWGNKKGDEDQFQYLLLIELHHGMDHLVPKS